MTITRRHLIAGVAAAGAALAGRSTASADPAPSLIDLIAAAPDGTPEAPTVIDGQGATFVHEETVRVSNRHHLILRNFTLRAYTDGAAAPQWLYLQWPRNRSHLRVDQGSSNILIENVTVIGCNPNAGVSAAAYVAALEAQHAFDIDDGSTFVTVRACQASDIYGDFVFIRAKDIVVEDCNFARNGRQGIATSHSERVRISRNRLDQCRRSFFDLEADLDVSILYDITIEDNITGTGKLLWLACAGQGSNIRRIIVRRNTMLGYCGTPVISIQTPAAHRRGPFTIEDNTFLVGGSPQPGVEAVRIDGFTFNRNRMQLQKIRNMTGVRLIAPTGVSMTGNVFIDGAVDYVVA